MKNNKRLKEKDQIEIRLNRIEGQVRAIKKMYQEGKSCIQIIQQVQAARAALAKVSGLVLSDEATKCAKQGNVRELEKVVERTFKTI